MFLRYEACPKCRSNGHDNRGDNLGRYDDGSAHCFSCGYHEHGSFGHVFQRKLLEDVPKSLRPTDFTREVPTRCLQWLLQFGLPYTHWQPTLGYSEHYQRLVFQVFTEDQLAFSIGRYFGTEERRKWHVWGDCHEHAHVLFGTNQTANSPVVLVEDLISAHKVNAAGFTCLPLFGTNVHKPALYYLMNQTQPVVLWLDKDQELNMKKQAMRLESIISNQVSVRSTDHDPKMLSFKQINEVINA
jgi:hypothetical protein